MTKLLDIEWRRLDKEGNTCLRCSDTGKTLEQVVEELADECSKHGVRIRFRETKLSEKEIPESNKILFNGVVFEDLLAGVVASQNRCASCCELISEETYCRTVEHEGQTYEAIPAGLIRQVACKLLDCCPPPSKLFPIISGD